jgi:hypothetical protein
MEGKEIEEVEEVNRDHGEAGCRWKGSEVNVHGL